VVVVDDEEGNLAVMDNWRRREPGYTVVERPEARIGWDAYYHYWAGELVSEYRSTAGQVMMPSPSLPPFFSPSPPSPLSLLASSLYFFSSPTPSYSSIRE